MIRLEGTLYTTSPLHITDASQDRRIESGNSTMPVTGTQTLTVVSRDPDSGETHTRRVPVIPSNSIRGRIRRAGADVLMEALKAKGENLTLPAYHTVCAGTADGRPDKGSSVSLSALHQRREHPFIGLFGGGPEMVESRFLTDTAWALVPETVASIDVPAACEDAVVDPMGREKRLPLTQVIYFRRMDDILQFSDPKAAERIEDYETAAQEWLDNQRTRSNGDEERGDRVQGWNATEIVLAGMPFSFRIGTTTSSSEVQDGLLLAALERFVERFPNLGGWKVKGFGRYDLSSIRMSCDGEDAGLVFTRDGGQLRLNRDNPAVAERLDAWASYANSDALTAAEIQEWAKAA
ncbi:CRISPR-associated protein, Csf2 family (plasmid) [Thioalkalivibrio sp. K90mix]|uniref:type IV CRISPR-associated protein Csf2 n=1 Tax=Thioalkalivibrio sp. (strain K90mix) TaxID=396595 RepID=UPI000195A44F|nr:type IV CRISPR-associated protein Csf2 [Thioalkalivibrio sp. K90mix]ADC73188.1 CRISPR-associated protein, Csf2 family [Thioalkalivibrio sp. K90mix]